MVLVIWYSSPSVEDHPHISPLNLGLVLFDGLDIDGVDAVVLGHLPVFLRLLAELAFPGAHVEKTVAQVFPGMGGILIHQVMEVAFEVVVGSGQVLGEKDVYGQRFVEGRDRALAGLGERIESVGGQVQAKEQALSDQDHQDQYDQVKPGGGEL
jgi:hypothetical protein